MHLLPHNHYYYPSSLSFPSPRKSKNGNQLSNMLSSKKYNQIKYYFYDENSTHERNHHYMIKRRVKRNGNTLDSISLMNLNQYMSNTSSPSIEATTVVKTFPHLRAFLLPSTIMLDVPSIEIFSFFFAIFYFIVVIISKK